MSTGRVAAGGYQAGVRRSFAVGSEMAWAAWGEPSGLVRWVGACTQELTEGARVELADGTRIQVVRQVPPRQLRLRLERDEWPRARTVQLRVLPSVHGVTVALHAEGLPDASAREEVLARWTRALESWEAFSGRTVEVNREGPPTREPAGKKGARKPPALEQGLAEKGAAALKEHGPAKGTKQAVAAKQPRTVKEAGGSKQVASEKKSAAPKKAELERKAVASKRAASEKKAVASKKAASEKKAVASKKAAPAKKAVASKKAAVASQAPGAKKGADAKQPRAGRQAATPSRAGRRKSSGRAK